MTEQDFRLDGPHGVLRGTLRMGEGPPPRTVVVVAHGFKGFKDWGFFPHLCRELARDGHAVVSFNFSGCGVGSDGESFTDPEGFASNTFSRERAELSWILERARRGALPGLPPRPTPRQVGALGHSRGGGIAVLAAAVAEPPVDALVTWAAVATFRRWPDDVLEAWRRTGRTWVLNARTGEQLPLDLTLLHDLEENEAALDVEAAAARVRAPWLVVHGTADPTVLLADAQRLLAAAPHARPALVEGAGHTFGATHPFLEVPQPLREAVEATREHFRRHLRPDG